MRKTIVALILLLLSLLLLSGCMTKISDINADPSDYMGKTVTVQGTVLTPIKMGVISGFTLKEDGTSILVSSTDVPSADAEVTVKGMVMKGMLMPQYIEASKIVIG
jgi:hypothetical protein